MTAIALTRARPRPAWLAPVLTTFRLHRFEAVAFAVLAAAGLGLAFLVAGRLDAIRPPAECWGSFDGSVMPPASCEAATQAFYGRVDAEAGKVSMITTVVPFLAGILLGAPLIGREVERGTARLAWSLGPSRLRWFLLRLVPVLALVVAGSLVLGAAADRLLASTSPLVDPGTSFEGFGARGPVLAARATWVFAVAVTAGAVLGRVLPAVIVAGVISAVGITGGSSAHMDMLRGEAVVIGGMVDSGDLWMDTRFQLPDGRLVDWQEMEQIAPPPTDGELAEGEMWPPYPQVVLGVPGERYAEVSLREIGVLGGAALALLAVSAIAVQRRRPG